MKLYKRIIQTFAFVLCAMAASFAVQSQAQSNAPHCDPQVLDLIETHAWMTAQREISQNQNHIYKPDSTLEYSCFDWLAIQMGFNWQPRPNGDTRTPAPGGVNHNFSQIAFVRPYFTDPVRQGLPRNGPGPDDYAPTIDSGTTELAIRTIVVQAAISYIQINFPHIFLAKRNPPSLDYTPGGKRATDRYECEIMEQVWNVSRCLNFAELFPEDGFYDFAWYSGKDPRNLPTKVCGPAGVFPAMLTEAKNEHNGNKKVETFTVDPTLDEGEFRNEVPYVEDRFNPHYELLGAPREVGQNSGVIINPDLCPQTRHIPTGNKVIELDDSEEDERICLSPSCTYDPGSRRCK